MNDKDGPAGAEQSPDPQAKGGLVKKTTVNQVILPEVLDALKQEGARVDVNVLLVQIFEKSHSPTEMVEYTERVLDVAKRFEEQRVENVTRMGNAVIDLKLKDPDEVEKRQNNRVRRGLKVVIAALAAFGISGLGLTAVTGGTIVVAAIFGGIATVALAVLAPLASGESVSSNDVVKIVRALRDMARFERTTRKDESEPQRKKRK